MTEVNVMTLAWLGILWTTFGTAVTVAAWLVSKSRVDAPLVVTTCVLLLAFFPPLNLLALTVLSAMDRKDQP